MRRRAAISRGSCGRRWPSSRPSARMRRRWSRWACRASGGPPGSRPGRRCSCTARSPGPAPSPGRPLEAEGNLRSREMTIHDRTRLRWPARQYAFLALYTHRNGTRTHGRTGVNRLVLRVLSLIQSANPDQGGVRLRTLAGTDKQEEHMRWPFAPAVSFSTAILAAACSGGTTSPSSTPAGSAAGSAKASTAATTRGQGGDLKILYWQPPTILNQHQATGTKAADSARLVLEPLAAIGPDGAPVNNGLLAEIPTIAN